MTDKYGAEDWSKYRPNVPRETLFDLAELAARLGSPVTFDRRGSVMFMDGFEGTLTAWKTTNLFDFNTTLLDQSTAFRGHQCVALFAQAGAGNLTSLFKYLPLYAVNRSGLEFHWSHGTGLKHFRMRVAYFAGSNAFLGEIQIDIEDNAINYLDKNNDLQKLADVNISSPSAKQWYAVKLVVDFTELEFVRFMLNKTEYSMDGIGLREAPAPLDPAMQALIFMTPDADDDQTVYLDDVIITSDEP